MMFHPTTMKCAIKRLFSVFCIAITLFLSFVAYQYYNLHNYMQKQPRYFSLGEASGQLINAVRDTAKSANPNFLKEYIVQPKFSKVCMYGNYEFVKDRVAAEAPDAARHVPHARLPDGYTALVLISNREGHAEYAIFGDDIFFRNGDLRRNANGCAEASSVAVAVPFRPLPLRPLIELISPP